MKKIIVFLQMIKFEHSIFALPFAYLGLFLAEGGWPRLSVFLWVTVAMVSFRTSAMSLNRLIDRQIDAQNPRTENRALPTGKLKVSFVWIATVLSLSVFLMSTAALNPLCLKLAWVPIVLAYFYPWLKRLTWTCHFVLGFVLGIAPYGAWIASQATFSWIPGFLSLGVIAWVSGFDIIYALQDEEFDRENKLFSFPARFGTSTSLWTVTFLHFVAVVCWFCVGFVAQLGWIYYLGLIVVVGFLIRENMLVRSLGFQKIQEAFFNMNAAVSVMILLAVIVDTSFKGVLS